MEELSGKTAVITGAASGIGLALAHHFGAEGMQLVLADIEAEPLAEADAALTAKGYTTMPFELDVRDLEQVIALEAAARERFGNIHLLCNNAGVGAGGRVAGLDDLEQWKWTIDINLWGVIYGCKVFLPGMQAHGEPAHIVNTASMAGHLSNAGMGPYSISKYGVVSLSETMARELDGTAVGVSALCPEFVQTRIGESDRIMPEDMRPEPTPENEAGREFVKALIAAGIETDEVARAVVNAVINDEFWIITHEGSREAIQARAEDIVNGVNPSPIFAL